MSKKKDPARFDTIRAKILKDYWAKISSRTNVNSSITPEVSEVLPHEISSKGSEGELGDNRHTVALKSVSEFIFFRILSALRKRSLFTLFKPKSIKKFILRNFFSEEEQAHFSDLRETWLQDSKSKYEIRWKTFNHIFLQKFIVPPMSRVCSLCARTVMHFLGSFR